MRKSVSVLLILLSLLIGFQRVIIVLHYQLNIDSIAQEFCENKDVPVMTCKGICYVRKAFQKTEDKASTASKIMYQKADVIFDTLIWFFSSTLIMELLQQVPPYLDIHYLNPSIEVLVPPPLFK